MKKNADRLSWINLLSLDLGNVRFAHECANGDNLLARAVRARLVAKARWFLLGVFALYGASAGSSFYFSQYGFFLSTTQVIVLLLASGAVIGYNTLFSHYFHKISKFAYANHCQIILDFIFVTILIHLSGGAASWFWPVYLIITIEAAFLLDRSRDVWLLGAAGGALYGSLLTLEHLNVIPIAQMPFVAAQLHHDSLYIFLMAVWVTITNAATAVIANFLMSVIRREASLLRESEERLLNFLDSANDLIHCNNLNGEFLYCNQAMLNALGEATLSLDHQLLHEIVNEDARDEFSDAVSMVYAERRSTALESVFLARDGREINVEGSITCGMKNGKPVAVWGIWRDISERKQSQAKLYNLAHHDNLTGLPNRILFIDRLKQAMALVHRQQKLAALLFLDLDRFKNINDTLGHPVGDRLLQVVAKRLTGAVREIDSVARFGGDEYTIILVNLEHAGDAEMIAKKILATLAKPYQVDSHELFVTASIGISLYPVDSEDVDNLIKKADIAMYHAKGQGGSRYLVYDRSMDEHAHKRLVLENNLRKALDLNEFRLHYQPKVDILSGLITSMEALLRWEHPEFGLLPPGDFIPLAEETGLIIPIGEWVMETACLQNLEWLQYGLPQMRVAVNLSGYQLQQGDFLERVKKVLAETGMDPYLLEFEITETVIMQNPEVVIGLLTDLREMGIHISIDDFGTGYSSLAHLKSFSVNTLKIDKSFVRDVVSNRTDAAIATAIIAMGNSLNLKVIAEGVETEGQYSFLQDTMCDEVQGYLVSRPMPADKVPDFMRTRGWKGSKNQPDYSP